MGAHLKLAALVGLSIAGWLLGCSLLAPSDDEAMAGKLTGDTTTTGDATTPGVDAADGGGDGPSMIVEAGLSDGDSAPRSVRRIRCGAPPSRPPYTDSTGQVWSNDAYYDDGSVVFNSDTIANTSDEELYHTERFGDRAALPNGFTYTFDGLPAGDYLVKLRFAETSGALITGPKKRLFNVLINGTNVLTEFDIFAEAGGRGRALDKTFPTTITSGPLVVRFTPGAIQNPKVNAIEIIEVSVGDR